MDGLVVCSWICVKEELFYSMIALGWAGFTFMKLLMVSIFLQKPNLS